MRAWLVVSTLMIATPVHADSVTPVTAAWEDGDTARVIVISDRLLGSTSLDAGARLAVLELRGAALAVDGREDDAIAAFKQVFALDPDAELLPYLRSPALRSKFEAARGMWRAETETFMRERHGTDLARIRLNVTPPPSPRGGFTLELEVDLDDPARLGRRVLFSFKRRTELGYTTFVQAAANHLRFAIPDQTTEARAPYVIDYYLVLRADNGYDVATYGDLQRPRQLAIAAGMRPQPAPPIYRRWWFWSGLGAVAGITGFVAYRLQDVGPQRGVSVAP